MAEPRVPTPKKACPYTFLLGRGKEPEPGKPGPLVVNAGPCIGSQCQIWLHDESGEQYGNCALALTGIFTAEAAAKAETLFELARQSEEQAGKAASLGNAALAQFRAGLDGALAKLTAAVEHLAELVEEGSEDDDEDEDEQAHDGKRG